MVDEVGDFGRLFRQNIDSEIRGMRKKVWRLLIFKGMGREVEG